MITNTQPVPTSAMHRPASAGPIIRASWKAVLFMATALPMISSPTRSETKLCRAGASKAMQQPSAKPKM